MSLIAFTRTILAVFNEDALTLTLEGMKPVIFRYAEHPEVFGHPRFLMVDSDKSSALIRTGFRQLAGKSIILVPPKVVIRFDRSAKGGISDMDELLIARLFKLAGAWKYRFNDA